MYRSLQFLKGCFPHITQIFADMIIFILQLKNITLALIRE